MRGSSVEASKANLQRVFIGALLMNWRVWTVTQWLSFHYVPPHLRVLWGASVTLSVFSVSDGEKCSHVRDDLHSLTWNVAIL